MHDSIEEVVKTAWEYRDTHKPDKENLLRISNGTDLTIDEIKTILNL